MEGSEEMAKKKKKFIPTEFMAEGSHYDEDQADYVVNFIQCLCHTKGKWAGKPFLLLPWQEEIIRNLFGILKADGKRQFTTAYIEIPKKNGKSELRPLLHCIFCLGRRGIPRSVWCGCRQTAGIHSL